MNAPDHDPISEQEQREAAALARALEGEASAAPAPSDALDAAALLRAASPTSELDPTRSEAILASLRPSLLSLPARRRWVAPALGAVTALAATVLAVLAPSSSMAPPAGGELPRPPRDLVAAQLASARRPTEADPELERALRQYRETLYAELERRHGGAR